MTTTYSTSSNYTARREYHHIDAENIVVEDFDIDFKLLTSIMYQQAPTGSQYEAIKKDFLLNLLQSTVSDVEIYEREGNIYAIKGQAENYPTVVAHYDTAQDYHKGLNIIVRGNWMFGFDTMEAEQCGIGADDSVGVYFAIEMLKRLPACKVVLFYGEERGCIGSNKCDMSFFKDSSIVTQLDRRSYTNDFINYTNGVTTFSKEHYDVITPLLEKYNYRLNSGSCTDVGKLRQRGLTVCSHNLSCGYFNEHSNKEIIHIPSMNNACMLGYELLKKVYSENLVLSFPEEVKSSYTSNADLGYSFYSRSSLFDELHELDDFNKSFEAKSSDEQGFEWDPYWGVMTKNGVVTSMYFRDFFPIFDKEEISEEYGYPKMSEEATLDLVKSGEIEPIYYSTQFEKHYSTFQDLNDKTDLEIRDSIAGGECPCCGTRSNNLQYHPEYNVTECMHCGSSFYVDFDMLTIEDLPLDRCQTFMIDNV